MSCVFCELHYFAWKTTHDDLRLAVDASSGGFDRLGVVPCSLTIYAARVRVVQPEVGHLWPAVNQFDSRMDIFRRVKSYNSVTEMGIVGSRKEVTGGARVFLFVVV